MKKLFQSSKRIAQKKRFIPTALGLLLIVLACWIQSRPTPAINFLLDRIHYAVYDMRTKLTASDHATSYTPIVIADIDEKSLAKLGRWPWPRNYIAKLVNQLFDHGAIVIAFDMLLSEPETNITDKVISGLLEEGITSTEFIKKLVKIAPKFDHDKMLASSLKGGDTVLGFVLHNNVTASSGGALPNSFGRISSQEPHYFSVPNYAKFQGNLAKLQDAATSGGAITVQPDDDGIIRRAPIMFRHGERLYPSLALEATKLFLLEDNIHVNKVQHGKFSVVESVSLGNKIIPTDHQGNVLIPFIGPAKTFPYLSAVDIIHGNIPADKLEGAMVFIGTSAFGLHDLKATAIQSVYPGVEIHANIAHNILQGRFPYAPDWSLGAQMCITVIAGLILLLMLPGLKVWGLIFTVVSTFAIIFSLETWLWIAYGIVIPLTVPLISVLLISILQFIYDLFYEIKHNKQVEALFSEYVPPSYLKSMLDSGGNFGFAGESREMTVLFSDIRNFTSISEKLNVIELKELLNKFFSEMTEIIFNHQGTIDKYVGDMVIAFWGAPMKDPDHSRHAVQGGLEMIAKTEALKEEFKAQGLPEVNIGVGVNSGPMNVGDMGSKFRRSYTVLGDAVNLGSRLESLTKFYGVKMIIGETTQQSCPDFIVRQLDKIRVKGKQEGITIYEPVALKNKIATDLLASIHRFQEALVLYYQQHWDQASQLLLELMENPYHAYVCKLYLKRIEYYKKNPPGDAWDGVYTAQSKSG